MNNCVSVVSLIIALAAVIIGPWVSLHIAKRQIGASTVTSSRQAWIDKLRDALAEFLSKSSMVSLLTKLHHADQDSIPRIQEVVELTYKIELLTNPREEDHSELVQLTQDITNLLNKSKSEDFDLKILDKKQRRIVELSQKILQREWERIKKGESH